MSGADANGATKVGFAKGELLTGEVIKSTGKDAVVKLKGVELLAKTARPLSVGQSILVRIDSVKPQLAASLLLNDTPAKEKAAAMLRLFLPQAMPLGSMLDELLAMLRLMPKSLLKGTGLDQLFKKLEQNPYAKDGKAGDENILRLLGLSHEADMAQGKPSLNLKHSLALLMANMDKLPEHKRGELQAEVKRILKSFRNIELQQFSSMEDSSQWEIPLWDGERRSIARLFIKRGAAKKEEGDEEVKLSIMVELSKLGAVRAELTADGSMLTGNIYLQDEQKKKLMQSFLPELERKLEESGWRVNLSASKATTSFLKEQRSSRLPVRSLLNLRV